MKIYLAGERAAMATTAAIRRLGGDAAASLWTKNVRRRLFSFYYHGFSGASYDRDPETGLSIAISDSIAFGWDLFLDSGAFTAFTKGVTISVDEYAEYVRTCAKKKIWTVASSLDAIGHGRQAAVDSWILFDKLRRLGARVQPVWHVREPTYVLRKYVDMCADNPDWDNYIFIGGMVPESTQTLRQILDDVWTKILTNEDGTAKVKVHGFGLTDSQLMFRYPWYSVDSSSWLMTGVFGACMFRTSSNRLQKVVFSDSSPEARKVKGWHYEKSMPEIQKRAVDRWLEPYGVTPEQLSLHYSFRDVVNASVFQSLEDLGTERFRREQDVLFEAEL